MKKTKTQIVSERYINYSIAAFNRDLKKAICFLDSLKQKIDFVYGRSGIIHKTYPDTQEERIFNIKEYLNKPIKEVRETIYRFKDLSNLDDDTIGKLQASLHGIDFKYLMYGEGNVGYDERKLCAEDISYDKIIENINSSIKTLKELKENLKSKIRMEESRRKMAQKEMDNWEGIPSMEDL